MNEKDRDALYKKFGFGHRMGFGQRPALLIVDMYRGATDPKSPLYTELSSVIEAIKQILSVARDKGIPVVYSTTQYEKGCSDAGLRPKKITNIRIFEEGTGYSEIDDRLKPLADEPIIRKKTASAFFGTPLTSVLVSKGVDTVIITGEATSGCVRAAAIDSFAYNFHTIVVREAVGDREASAHAQNLYDMDMKYADVVSLKEVLNYLSSIRAVAGVA